MYRDGQSVIWRAIFLLQLLILSLSATALSGQQATPDRILVTGKLFTSDAANPYVQALAIRGERISATGDSAKIKSLAGPHAKEIDLDCDSGHQRRAPTPVDPPRQLDAAGITGARPLLE